MTGSFFEATKLFWMRVDNIYVNDKINLHHLLMFHWLAFFIVH